MHRPAPAHAPPRPAAAGTPAAAARRQVERHRRVRRQPATSARRDRVRRSGHVSHRQREPALARPMHLLARAPRPSTGNTVRSTSCRATTAASAAPSAAASTPPQPHRQRHVVLRRPRSSWSGTTAAAARTTTAAPVRGRDHAAAAAAAPRPASITGGQPGHGRVIEQRRQPAAPPRAPPGPGRSPAWPAANARRARRSRPRPRPAPRPAPRDQIPHSSLLRRRPRRHVLAARSARPSGRGQRRPVQLPVRSQRQRVQLHEHRRDHVLGQRSAARQPAQLVRRRDARGRVGGHQLGDQPRSPSCSPAPTTAAGRDAGWAASTASISPGSIRKPRTLTCSSARPRNSSCPSGRHRARSPVRYIRRPAPPNGSGHEPLRGQRRPAQVPARQPRPAMYSSPAHPGRHRPQPLVQHVHPGVGDRARRSAASPVRPVHGRAVHGDRPWPRSARSR